MLRLDWREMIRTLVAAHRSGASAERLAAAFHRSIAAAAIGVVRHVAHRAVVLAGGVFCNRYLTETLLEALEHEGFEAHLHSQLPPTDGSLAAGQLWIAAHRSPA